MMAVVGEAEGDPRIRSCLMHYLTRQTVVNIYSVSALVGKRKLHFELRAYRGYLSAVEMEAAAVLSNVRGNAAEGNIKASARMRLDRGGVNVALDLKVILLSDLVIYSLVHLADIISVELYVLLVCDNVNERLVISASSTRYVSLNIIKTFGTNLKA